MKEDKVYASLKARADSVHQFLANGSLRKKELFFNTMNSQSYSISKDPRHFFPVPTLGMKTHFRRREEKGDTN